MRDLVEMVLGLLGLLLFLSLLSFIVDPIGALQHLGDILAAAREALARGGL